MHLIKSHCAGKAARLIRTLPARQKATAANLIAALKSAFDDVVEEDAREVQAHRALLELEQRKGEDATKYARRARRISEHIDPKYDHLLTLKFRDGFRSKTLQMYLSVDSESPEKFTFGQVYKRFLGYSRISRRRQKKGRADSFSSSESESEEESESDSDTDIPEKKKKKKTATTKEHCSSTKEHRDDSDGYSSSSDEEPARQKRKNRLGQSNRKDPIKAIEELKELLTAKSSSEAPAADLRPMRKPTLPLDSFEASQIPQCSDTVKDQKLTITELRRLLVSDDVQDREVSIEELKNALAPEVNAVGLGRGRIYPQQGRYQHPQDRYPQDQCPQDCYPQDRCQPDRRYHQDRYPQDRYQPDHRDYPPDRQQQPPQYAPPSQARRGLGYQPLYRVPTCFACGLKGHRRPECTNPPLPVEEQQRLYEDIMFSRDRTASGGKRQYQAGGQQYGNHGTRAELRPDPGRGDQTGRYPYQRFQDPPRAADRVLQEQTNRRYGQAEQQPEQNNRGYASQGQPPQQQPPPSHRQAMPDQQPRQTPPGQQPTGRIEAVATVEGLELPKHSSGYSNVTFDESAMLEVMAGIEDGVHAAEKRKRGGMTASGTDAGRARKQQVVSDPSLDELLIVPESSQAAGTTPTTAPVPIPRMPPNSAPMPAAPTAPVAEPPAPQRRQFLRSQTRREADSAPPPPPTPPPPAAAVAAKSKSSAAAPANGQGPIATPPDELPATTAAKIKRARRPFQPIRLMKGHNQFDFIKSFRNAPVAGITWGDLINLAPLVKRDVARALTREQLVPRKKKVRIAVDQVEDTDTVEIRRALPEGFTPVQGQPRTQAIRGWPGPSVDGLVSVDGLAKPGHLFGASRGPMPSADGPGLPRMGWHP